MPARLRQTVLPVLVAIAALALGGCALMKVPPAGGYRPTTTTVPAVTHNEVATPPGPDEHAVTAASPQVALSHFAVGYINWDAADLKRRLESLAAASVGQARAAMELEASETGSDPELKQAGIANQGSVEAVAAVAGGHDRYVVVTRESTTATNSSEYAGLAPAWHLTLATVTRRDGGWVISGWQPET